MLGSSPTTAASHGCSLEVAEAPADRRLGLPRSEHGPDVVEPLESRRADIVQPPSSMTRQEKAFDLPAVPVAALSPTGIGRAAEGAAGRRAPRDRSATLQGQIDQPAEEPHSAVEWFERHDVAVEPWSFARRRVARLPSVDASSPFLGAAGTRHARHHARLLRILEVREEHRPGSPHHARCERCVIRDAAVVLFPVRHVQGLGGSGVVPNDLRRVVLHERPSHGVTDPERLTAALHLPRIHPHVQHPSSLAYTGDASG